MKLKILILVGLTYIVCQSYSKGKRIDWHCPEIAQYKHHFKKNRTNGLYYFDERLPSKKEYGECVVGLSTKQVEKILGKPNVNKRGFLGNYMLYAYYVDTTYKSVPQDWNLIYVRFDSKTHLSSYGFDLQRYEPPIP